MPDAMPVALGRKALGRRTFEKVASHCIAWHRDRKDKGSEILSHGKFWIAFDDDKWSMCKDIAGVAMNFAGLGFNEQVLIEYHRCSTAWHFLTSMDVRRSGAQPMLSWSYWCAPPISFPCEIAEVIRETRETREVYTTLWMSFSQTLKTNKPRLWAASWTPTWLVGWLDMPCWDLLGSIEICWGLASLVPFVQLECGMKIDGCAPAPMANFWLRRVGGRWLGCTILIHFAAPICCAHVLMYCSHKRSLTWFKNIKRLQKNIPWTNMKKSCCMLLPKVSNLSIFKLHQATLLGSCGLPKHKDTKTQRRHNKDTTKTQQRHNKDTTIMSRLAQGKVSEHGEDAPYSTIFIHIPPYSTYRTYAYLMLCWYYLRFCWGFGKHSSLHVRPFAPLSQQIWIGIPWSTTIVCSRENESGCSRFPLQTT